MRMPKNITQYRIVRYAGYQGMRPSMTHQAEVERFATGKERSSQPSHLSTLTKKKNDKIQTEKVLQMENRTNQRLPSIRGFHCGLKRVLSLN